MSRSFSNFCDWRYDVNVDNVLLDKVGVGGCSGEKDHVQISPHEKAVTIDQVFDQFMNEFFEVLEKKTGNDTLKNALKEPEKVEFVYMQNGPFNSRHTASWQRTIIAVKSDGKKEEKSVEIKIDWVNGKDGKIIIRSNCLPFPPEGASGDFKFKKWVEGIGKKNNDYAI